MRLNDLPLIMLRCLLCTELIECGAAFLLRRRTWREQRIILLVNLMTNPLAVILPVTAGIFFGRPANIVAIIVLELFAVFSEALVYRHFFQSEGKSLQKLPPLALSLILNFCSWSIGELLNRYLF